MGRYYFKNIIIVPMKQLYSKNYLNRIYNIGIYNTFVLISIYYLVVTHKIVYNTCEKCEVKAITDE